MSKKDKRASYDLDMAISLEGLQMSAPPVEEGQEPEPVFAPRIFFNTAFMIIKKFSDAEGGLNGQQHGIIFNIRNQMEQAVDVKDTSVVLSPSEIRLLNEIFVKTKTGLETNEIRQRIHKKIQESLNPKEEPPKADTAEGAEVKIEEATQ